MSSESDVYLRSVKVAEKAHIMLTGSDVYLRFVKLTEHALTPTQKHQDLQIST
jgi:hypothetical protein